MSEKREAAVKQLVQKHKDLANQYALMSNYHHDLSKDYEAYLYELRKPGFKTKGWYRYAKKGRTEPYVVQAHEGSVDG